MADVKYWCSDQARTDGHLRPGKGSVLLQCMKDECEMWDSDLSCPALSLSVTVRGRTEVCYSGGE